MSSDPFPAAAAALESAYEISTAYVAGLQSRPVAQPVTPEEMAARLDEPLPEVGSDPGATVIEWFERAEPGIVASSGPRMFGWVLGGTTPGALAGDWLASALDQTPSMWDDSPAAIQTELTVMRWLKELFNLPAEWEGVLTSGATTSNMVGLAAARQWVGAKMGFDPSGDGLGGQPPIPVVSSTEIHASAVKAIGNLGIGRNSVIKIPAPDSSVDLKALRDTLAEIDGPVIVIGNAGEVNTGKFDNLTGLAEICKEHPHGAWLHVDAAFGIFAAVSPEYAHFVAGIELADSVAADAHKWLNVPYDSGFVLVRNPKPLRDAFSASASYLGMRGMWDPMNYLPEMSRRFRALAAWCSLKSLGRAGYREIVERNCAQAQAFGRWLADAPGFELMAPVNLNIVCFRYLPDEASDDVADELNRRAVPAIQAKGKAFVTPAVWNGRAAIRAAFDNWATTNADVELLKEALLEVQ